MLEAVLSILRRNLKERILHGRNNLIRAEDCGGSWALLDDVLFALRLLPFDLYFRWVHRCQLGDLESDVGMERGKNRQGTGKVTMYTQVRLLVEKIPCRFVAMNHNGSL